MTPVHLAKLHPKMYHLCEAEAVDSVMKHGLWSTERLLAGCGLTGLERSELLSHRRPRARALQHTKFGTVTINDNLPLSEKKLAACLDDGLSVADWLNILNRFVFFWANQSDVEKLHRAVGNRGRSKALLVVDTKSLTEAYAEKTAFASINTGQTRFPMKQAARRGRNTFARLTETDYPTWRRLNRQSGKIKEIVIADGIADIRRYVIEIT